MTDGEALLVYLATMVLRSRLFLSGSAYLWLMKALGIGLLIVALVLFRSGLTLLSE